MAQQNKDTNELIKVRRQKLADLQAAGKNPFEIMKYDVTHHSKEIKDNFEKSTPIPDYNDKILMVLANRYKSMTNEELNTWIRKFYL